MSVNTDNFSFQGVGVAGDITVWGCMDISACNYDPLATIDNNTCLTDYGCMDINADNYDPSATCSDGDCDYSSSIITGCTNSIACNYNSLANTDDGSCILPDGCTDPSDPEYDASALCDDGSCVGLVITTWMQRLTIVHVLTQDAWILIILNMMPTRDALA